MCMEVNEMVTKSLHELKDDLNQLGPMEVHCRRLLSVLDPVILNTEIAAPIRLAGDHNVGWLDERPAPAIPAIGPFDENQLEVLLRRQFGPQPFDLPEHYVLPYACRRIHARQIPLRDKRADAGWRAIDLIGVSEWFTPVIFELKDGDSDETILRMILEGVAYAIAVRKTWNAENSGLREEWETGIMHGYRNQGLEISLPMCPHRLHTVRVVCIAPTEFWTSRICTENEDRTGTNHKVFPGDWRPLAQLARAFGERGFPVTFAAFDVVPTSEGAGTTHVGNVRNISLPTEAPATKRGASV